MTLSRHSRLNIRDGFVVNRNFGISNTTKLHNLYEGFAPIPFDWIVLLDQDLMHNFYKSAYTFNKKELSLYER